MDKFFVRIYIDQIKDQINEAEKAHTLVLANLVNDEIDSNELFSNIHHFIIHVSNVVKLLQPNVKDDNDFRKYRALSIRKEYPDLPQINPKDIHIRNDFEHFDERIDNWVINSRGHNYLDKNIGNIDLKKAISGIDFKDSFRWFDLLTKTLYFCGNSYNLDTLHDYIIGVNRAL